MTADGATLVFPGGIPESLAYAAAAAQRGEAVIGASSLASDPAAGAYPHWLRLPYIDEPGFADSLAMAIRDNGIARVFSAHQVVRRQLARMLDTLSPAVLLVGAGVTPPSLGASFVAPYRDFFDGLPACSPRREPLGEGELAAILDRAIAMTGESGLAKLVALAAIAGSAPRGDVVEIGCLAGRSAFMLGWLARRYRIGATLCVDPWSSAAARQTEVPTTVAAIFASADFDDFFAEFRRNLVPCFHETLNYRRLTSHEARAAYGEGFVVTTPEFGTTRYAGRAAILHLDGNHDFPRIAADLEDWLPALLPGGWLVVDDYVWRFGDGPRRAADRLLEASPEDFECGFVADGALFLRRAAR
jgi:SAM-dependent methyltransferase